MGDARRSGGRGRAEDHSGHSTRAALLKLLYPGLGVKRWLVLGALGIALCSVGLVFILRRLIAAGLPDFLPVSIQGVMLLCLGALVIALAGYGLYRSIAPLILAPTTINALANTLHTRRALVRGPRIVAIGGGTGLSVLLRGLKAHTENLTAIVAVGDDGGSSGRLRSELGVVPPGDFRNCLVAMSDAEPLVMDLFQYRFNEGNGLKGHSFGNLFIVAMTNITKSFDRALRESSRVLAVHGQIVPSTVANLRLWARMSGGEVVRGESNIARHDGKIEQVFIDPADAKGHPAALKAIDEADLIVIGPGSLYTSVLPNLLVSDIAQAIGRSEAPAVYICNMATQKGETEGYAVADHLEALRRHTTPSLVGYVVADSRPVELGPQFFGTPVAHNGRPLAGVELILADLRDASHPVRHDSAKLARTVMDVYHRRRRSRYHPRLGNILDLLLYE